MKKALLSAALLLMAGTASAQFSWCPEVDTNNYSRFQASFISEQLTNMGVDSFYDPKGVSVGYLTGLSVSDNFPLFLETGANLSWTHSVEDYFTPSSDIKFTHMNIALPLNLAYKFTINDRFNFVPFVGLNFKFNVLATQKIDGKKYNMLNKDDMGGRDNRGKYFQLGGHTGVGINLSEFYLGWEYQGDFMRFTEMDNGDKNKFHANYLTVGYSF